MAIEEAFLADKGFTEKLIADIDTAAGNTGYDESILKGVLEAAGSNQDTAYHFLNQVNQSWRNIFIWRSCMAVQWLLKCSCIILRLLQA